MTDLPLHTRRLVEQLLDRYCARICAPPLRRGVQLAWRIEGSQVTIAEDRLFCGVPGAHTLVDVARCRFNPRTGDWQLLHADDAGRWRPYPGAPRHASFVQALRVLDDDPAGMFWGQVDGKSLRWCSSRGRCADCDVRYCAILGLVQDHDLRKRATGGPVST